MNILTFPLGQLQANCYLVEEEGTCIIIDPADSAEFLSEEIERRNLKPLALLATHGHFDHVMAVGELQMSYGIPFYICQEDLFLLQRLTATAEHFLKYKPYIVKPTLVNYLSKGELKIENFKFQILSTPGHTPGSCCFYFENEKAMFTGDTLFKDGIGRYDFKYSNKHDLYKSLHSLFTLDGIVTVYPGHGEKTLLHLEKENAMSYL